MRSWLPLLVLATGCPGDPSDDLVDTDPADTDAADTDGDPTETDPGDTDTGTVTTETDDTGCDASGEGFCGDTACFHDCLRTPRDFDAVRDELRVAGDEASACQARVGTCTDAGGRTLWVLEDHGFDYFDAATGQEVARRRDRWQPITHGRIDRHWWGEVIRGCVPEDEALVGCDTGDLCDGLVPVLPPSADVCALWPAHAAVLDPADATALPSDVDLLRAGDLTGDGVDDLLIGPSYGPYRVLAGGPDVFERDGAAPDAEIVVQGLWERPATGDVDGDGQRDFVVGSRVDGTVLVFLGPLAGTLGPEDADVVVTGPAAGWGLHRVIVPGDLDADGDDDIVMTGTDRTAIPSGWADSDELWVVDLDRRTDAAPQVSIDEVGVHWFVTANYMVYLYPWAVGDLDGDGAAEVAIASDDVLFVLTGSQAMGGGDLADAAWRFTLSRSVGGFREPLGADLDGDGTNGLVLVGPVPAPAPATDDVPGILVLEPLPAHGAHPPVGAETARVVGRPWTWDRPFDRIGAVAAPGDLDGDGVADLLVVNPSLGAERTCDWPDPDGYRPSVLSQQGAVRLLRGPFAGERGLSAGTTELYGGAYGGGLGTGGVVDVGDVDDDGVRDLLVRAPYGSARQWVPGLPATYELPDCR